MKHGLDVVAVGIDHERALVGRSQAGRSVGAARGESGGAKASNRRLVRCLKGQCSVLLSCVWLQSSRGPDRDLGYRVLCAGSVGFFRSEPGRFRGS